MKTWNVWNTEKLWRILETHKCVVDIVNCSNELSEKTTWQTSTYISVMLRLVLEHDLNKISSLTAHCTFQLQGGSACHLAHGVTCYKGVGAFILWISFSNLQLVSVFKLSHSKETWWLDLSVFAIPRDFQICSSNKKKKKYVNNDIKPVSKYHFYIYGCRKSLISSLYLCLNMPYINFGNVGSVENYIYIKFWFYSSYIIGCWVKIIFSSF